VTCPKEWVLTDCACKCFICCNDAEESVRYCDVCLRSREGGVVDEFAEDKGVGSSRLREAEACCY